jgi:hypothetical protein
MIGPQNREGPPVERIDRVACTDARPGDRQRSSHCAHWREKGQRMNTHIDYRRMTRAVTWGVFSGLVWFVIALLLAAIVAALAFGVGLDVLRQFVGAEG